MSNFTVFNKEISFLESSDRYYKISQERRKVMASIDSEFEVFYRSQGNIRAVLENYIEKASAIIKSKALDKLFEKLPEIGIYDVTERGFREACWNLEEVNDAFDAVVDFYNEIEEELALEKAYREERKASRGRWVGGGFGLGGAIKGAATAGALNMASGLGHSLVNSFGNAKSESAAREAKRQMYKAPEVYNKLCVGIKFAIWDVYDEFMMMVNERFEEAYFANEEFEDERAEALFENAKRFPDKREELLHEALQACPYNADLLIYVFENYPAERNAISEMAKLYDKDISGCYENVFMKMYGDFPKAGEKELLKIKAELQAKMKDYGVQTSQTMTILDYDYLYLVYDKYYKNLPTEERTQALDKVRQFDTTDQVKRDFVKQYLVWELCRKYFTTFTQGEKARIVQAEYKLLQKNGATAEKTTAVLKEVLTALGIADTAGEEERVALFFDLCEKSKEKATESNTVAAKKEALLRDVFSVWSTYKLMVEMEKPVDKHVVYQSGEAHKLARQQSIVNLQPGEYLVALYTESLIPEKIYKSGIAITDRRLVCRGIAAIDASFASYISIKSGSFFSGDIIITINGIPHEIDLPNYPHKGILADYLQKTVNGLQNKQKQLEQIETSRKEEEACKQAQTVQNNELLVQHLMLQSWAERTIGAGEAAAKKQKQAQLTSIMKAVKKDDPATIAKAWCAVDDSGVDADMIAESKAKLYGMLHYLATNAESLATLEKLEAARQTILAHGEAAQMQDLKAAMDARHDEAARLGEITQQKKKVAQIMQQCDTKKLESILVTWDAFVQSGCEKVYYQACLELLDNEIRNLVNGNRSKNKLEILRRQLAENNADRYREHIQTADEILHGLETKERTYRGVLFDSAEEIVSAQEEEKRLDIIMHTVDRDDVNSIENAIRQVNESTSKIKIVYLEQLNTYKSALEEQLKTYRGVIYETVELAEQARSAHISARSIMNQVDLNSEPSVLNAYEQIKAMNHPITDEFLKTLQDRLDVFDKEKRTVDGLLLATVQEADLARNEYALIQREMYSLDENNEAGMLAIRQTIAACTTVIKEKYLEILDAKLKEYDVRARTFRSVLYDTRELAAKHREEATAAEQIVKSVNTNDEQTMLNALEALKNLTTDEKNAPIKTVEIWLKEYDIKVRTVAGVLYKTREEAQLVASELCRAEEIMGKVSAEDEQSILNAQNEILTLTTFVKDTKYEELNKMWQAYDLKARTYQSIVFTTRKQAQVAQQTHTEFLRMFNTMDLSQRSTMTALSDYIEDCIPPELVQQTTAMVKDVTEVLNLVDYIIQQDAVINITTQKKESEKLYKHIETVLPAMTRYRMNTDYMQQLKEKHYASLNAAKKLFSFFKSKF